MQTPLEVLGEVQFPSGAAMVIDTAALRLWCHDRPPKMPSGVLATEAATQSANKAQDFRIDGPEAELAGQLYNRQWHPRYLFDVPGHTLEEFRQTFQAFLMQKGLDARLVPLFPRVTHLERVALALQQGGGGGELQVHGVPAVAVQGFPPGKRLRVVGAKRGAQPFPELWQWVGVEVNPGAEIASSVLAGRVASDWARLMFVDPRTLQSWQHSETLDGLADFVFWGPDGMKASTRFSAPAVEDGLFGWKNLPVHEAAERGSAVEEAVKDGELKLRTSFREHSHHHALLEQIRTSQTRSGWLDLEDGRLCAFFTEWGDGVFPVYRDLDAGGGLVRLRVELATEKAIELMKHAEAHH